MGTHDTNDDGAMGLPAKRPITQYEDPANYEIEPFDEMTGPHDGRTPVTSKAAAVIADEQRMADVFAECAKAVAALRGGVVMLDEVANGMGDQPRFRTSLLMEAAADSLETAIARANGGAA